MKLLLLSNSTNPGENFLEYSKTYLKEFLGSVSGNIVFIPYAAVSISFDQYEQKVQEAFQDIGYPVISLHHSSKPNEVIEQAGVIITGGGNTFHLLHFLQQFQLLDIIRQKVLNGCPYIGWSAGSNIACPTISTTNDMPIVETNGFSALNLIPFQLNPHYTNRSIPGHGGETRDQRIQEYLAANPTRIVVGLREGTILKRMDDTLQLLGNTDMQVFTYKHLPYAVSSSHNLNFLLEK